MVNFVDGNAQFYRAPNIQFNLDQGSTEEEILASSPPKYFVYKTNSKYSDLIKKGMEICAFSLLVYHLFSYVFNRYVCRWGWRLPIFPKPLSWIILLPSCLLALYRLAQKYFDYLNYPLTLPGSHSRIVRSLEKGPPRPCLTLNERRQELFHHLTSKGMFVKRFGVLYNKNTIDGIIIGKKSTLKKRQFLLVTRTPGAAYEDLGYSGDQSIDRWMSLIEKLDCPVVFYNEFRAKNVEKMAEAHQVMLKVIKILLGGNCLVDFGKGFGACAIGLSYNIALPDFPKMITVKAFSWPSFESVCKCRKIGRWVLSLLGKNLDFSASSKKPGYPHEIVIQTGTHRLPQKRGTASMLNDIRLINEGMLPKTELDSDAIGIPLDSPQRICLLKRPGCSRIRTVKKHKPESNHKDCTDPNCDKAYHVVYGARIMYGDYPHYGPFHNVREITDVEELDDDEPTYAHALFTDPISHKDKTFLVDADPIDNPFSKELCSMIADKVKEHLG